MEYCVTSKTTTPRATSLRVNHVGLTVTDLETSIDFYTKVVGMTFLRRGFKTGGEWFDTLTNNDGAIIDAAHVGFEGFSLQLVQYHAGADDRSQTGHNRAGNMHLCVDVDDVDAKHAEVSAIGAHKPTPIVLVAGGPARSFYVEDPDGIPVEFLHKH
jgi:catechol 2,3-dioxygenase-like lactoylglutathione lyase family enzyme